MKNEIALFYNSDFEIVTPVLVDQKKTALDSIVAYFDRFGSKSCCFEDIQTYITFLRNDKVKAKEFVSSLVKTVGDSKEKVNADEERRRRRNIF